MLYYMGWDAPITPLIVKEGPLLLTLELIEGQGAHPSVVVVVGAA